ncbi:MAG: hypothetical protein ACI8RD_008963, partial [Bacillariaceae sp.]
HLIGIWQSYVHTIGSMVGRQAVVWKRGLVQPFWKEKNLLYHTRASLRKSKIVFIYLKFENLSFFLFLLHLFRPSRQANIKPLSFNLTHAYMISYQKIQVDPIPT